MPKGKPKKNNPDLYQGSHTFAEPSMAPQAIAHRRGGTHKVRDEDRTDSIYDTYNYKELLDTAKERGIYRKDMKKVEMAWALKRNDEEKKKAEHQAKMEHERKQQEARKEREKKAAQRQALIAAKHKRRLEKTQQRDRDESVSDDTLSDAEIELEAYTRNEYAREPIGEVLSDESWDSTSTESSTRSTDYMPKHDCKLRLFEWPYDYMPRPDSTPRTIADLARLPDPAPHPVPYAPLKLATTHTRQKLILPGSRYPASVAPNYVPILNAPTRLAAHSAHMIGLLRNAVIETGTFWAAKTFVQGTTARMYFHLCSRNESKQLADTYQKWYLEDRKLLRVKGRGDGVREDRRRRHEQRRRNKGRRMAEVYESCKWRPLAMGYAPAYLDFGEAEAWARSMGKGLRNLRYVRFEGCDVPHYYFWVKQGEEGFVREGGGSLGFREEDEDEDEDEGEDEPEEPTYEEIGGDNRSDTSNDPTNAKALCRRSSAVRTHAQSNKRTVVQRWLGESSSFSPPSSHGLPSPTAPTLSFLDAYPSTVASTQDDDEAGHSTRTTCPFCSLYWDTMASEDQVAHMLSHSFALPCTTATIAHIYDDDDDDDGTLADVDAPAKSLHRRKKKKQTSPSSGKRKRESHDSAKSARERCAGRRKKARTGVAKAPCEYEGLGTASAEVQRKGVGEKGWEGCYVM